MLIESKLSCHSLQSRTLRTVTDEQQLGRYLFLYDLKRLYDIFDALYFPEITGVHQYLFTLRGYGFTEMLLVEAAKPAEVDKIIDHFDFLLDLELLTGLLPEVIGNRGYTITLVDTEGYYRSKGPVAAYQSDICAVQCCDYRNVDAFICQDLLGQVSDSGMGYSIVDMQEVQFFIFDHIDQLTGEGGIIGGIIEKRILLGVDLMKKHIFLVVREADRTLVGNEVNLVSFCSQGET